MARAGKNVMNLKRIGQARDMRNQVARRLEELKPLVWPDTASRQAFERQMQLSRSEWATAEAIAAYQLERLKALGSFAARESPYWRERLPIAAIAGAATLQEALDRIPVLSRAELRDNPATLRAERLPPGHRPADARSSSGSTGMVVVVERTDVVLQWQNSLAFRCQLWARRDMRRRIAVIRRYPEGAADAPDGLTVERWAPPDILPFDTGPSFHLTTFNTSMAQVWDWLERVSPAYLMAYPSVVRALSERARDEGRRPAPLEGITTVGEVVTPEVRELAVRYLDAPISDIYSSEEAGTMAVQCPVSPLYHVQAEVLILEVLDETGRPCSPGEMGHVVVTPLHNYAMPLFRYDIGDFAEASAPCGCGRGLPALARILGRRRNMLTLSDGRSFWPSFGARLLQRIVPMRAHQFRQLAPDVLEALLVTEADVSPAQEEEMRQVIASVLPAPFHIAIRCVPEIPRSAGGKHEEFISLVDRAPRP